MSLKIEKFFTRHGIGAGDILYIDRYDKKTRLHLINGESILTYVTVKEFLASLPPDKFVGIDKGIVIARGQVANVSGTTYVMSNGDSLEGRKSRLSPHKQLLRMIREDPERIPSPDPDEIAERFSILDKLPAPFSVISPVYRAGEAQGDFSILYANESAKAFRGETTANMVGKTVLSIFPLIDKNALNLCADTVQTGITHSYTGFSNKSRYTYTLHFFRPIEGCCAVMMTIHL